MDNVLNAEVSWNDFLSNIDGTIEDRYVRINPNIDSKPPELDAIDRLESLRVDTRKALSREKSTIQDVGWLLISSSFFFDMVSPPSSEGTAGFKCTGNKPMAPLDMSIF